jgi:hypothetical protein
VDKYVGRTVDVEKFEELLGAFFTVGGVVQGDVICSVIEQGNASFSHKNNILKILAKFVVNKQKKIVNLVKLPLKSW